MTRTSYKIFQLFISATDFNAKSPDPVCFLCKNNHCVVPQLAFYDPTPKDDLCCLCDKYKHCLDGSDES